jgi:hypothetical protein
MSTKINFNELPNSAPNNFPLVAIGRYYATIDLAEMKQGKDTTKPPYLNLRYSLTTGEGETAGKLYDMLFATDHEIVRYKLKRFIEALELPITGDFHLEDLTKVVINKKLIVDVTHDTKGEKPKAVVDVFKGAIFYPMNEAGELFENVTTTTTTDVVNATDAEDTEY